MAKVIVYLREQEMQALNLLAQKEYRAPKAQAALMLRTELERLGMLDNVPTFTTAPEAHHDAQHAS
jgi:hypothetical protein